MTQEKSYNRTLILGSGPFAQELILAIKASPEYGLQLIGVIGTQSPDNDFCQGCPILGKVDELHDIIIRTGTERIIVALPSSSDLLPDHQLIEARVSRDIIIHDGDEVYEKLTGKLRIEALEPRVMIYNKTLKPSPFSVAVARIMSLVLAVPALLLLAPLLVLIGIAVKMDSAGPMLFVQERAGLGGKGFHLLKFRTMRPVEKAVSEWAGDNSDRITKVGRILRKYRLDELPQLLNVLKGDMNIVGPRPHPATNFRLFVLVSRNMAECGVQIPYYSLRSLVRPGITGWAQVRYRYANNLREEIEKLRFDLYYVKHYSILLDFQILFETIAVVVFGREFATDPVPEEQAIPEIDEIEEQRPLLSALSGEGRKRFASAKRVAPRSN